ncbi:adenylyltransferase/cytidyltransferase family protein [Candidatus Micrarchaeota archaeon]|nr:adenylyltransferase/cytidyltransferase family protein [Candidatus Micrarchaeota archaeon]
MGSREDAISLYLLQVEENGISASTYSNLEDSQKAMLEVGRGGRHFLKREHRKKFKVAMTGGVFDVIHIGHIDTLTRAKENADILIAVVAQDSHIHNKSRTPLHTQEYRQVLVQALKPVDLAILGGENAEETLERVHPDAIVYGYDQKPFLKPEGVEIIGLKSKIDPKNVKTSTILEKLGI